MISLIGPSRKDKKAFTLVEVLVAVAILSIGIIGISRAYITLMDGIEASVFTADASYLLKLKIADIEKTSIENSGVPSGSSRGIFGGGYSAFAWQAEVSEMKASSDKSKDGEREWPEESLSMVRVSITGAPGSGTGRKLDLYTYVENHFE